MADAASPGTDPVLTRFRAALETIQISELQRLYSRLPELDDQSRVVIGQFADRIVKTMLHPALETLREETRTGSEQGLLDALQRLFRLSE